MLGAGAVVAAGLVTGAGAFAHAEHAAIEILGALEILRYQQEVVQLGEWHGSS